MSARVTRPLYNREHANHIVLIAKFWFVFLYFSPKKRKDQKDQCFVLLWLSRGADRIGVVEEVNNESSLDYNQPSWPSMALIISTLGQMVFLQHWWRLHMITWEQLISIWVKWSFCFWWRLHMITYEKRSFLGRKWSFSFRWWLQMLDV